MKTVLIALILSTCAFAQLPGIGGDGGGAGGGGGSGCIPAGSAGQVLSDDGAGACTSNSTAAGFLTFMETPSSANLAALLTNETGTSLAVFNTNALLITPKVTTITDANGNPFLTSSATASAVDSVTITNAATGSPATVQISATGSDSNINLSLIGKGTGNVNFPNGSTNGSSPPSLTAGTGGADAYGEGTVPSVCSASGVDCLYASSTQHGLLASFNNGSYLPIPQGPASTTSTHLACWNATNGGLLSDCTTPGSLVLTNATGLPSAQVPAVPLTAGTSVTLSENHRYFVCTGTCTVTVPVPAAGVEYCVYNDDNVSTVITLAAIGSSARYENTARTAYGTAGTGTFISGGAAADKVCIVGRDATHYSTIAYNGTWTAN